MLNSLWEVMNSPQFNINVSGLQPSSSHCKMFGNHINPWIMDYRYFSTNAIFITEDRPRSTLGFPPLLTTDLIDLTLDGPYGSDGLLNKHHSIF